MGDESQQTQSHGWEGITEGFAGTVGGTPLIRIASLSAATGCNVLAKAEFMSPGGSIKDRAGKFMLEAALQRGDLKPGGLVVEATAGNTGVGLIHVALSHGLRCVFCCPSHVSGEKIALLQRLGAEVVLCPKGVPLSDPRHYQNTARRIAEDRGGFYVNQFYNEDNARAHYEMTGPEIWRQTNGNVHALAVAPGTGGTLSGCSRYLKERNEAVMVFMNEVQGSGVTLASVEPPSESVASADGDTGGDETLPELRVGATLREKNAFEKDNHPVEEMRRPTLMEGIGSSILYGNLKDALVDGVVRVVDEHAVQMCHYVLQKDGLYVGGSAGLNLCGAYVVAKRLGPGHTVVTFLCDSGERYASKIFNAQWLEENNMGVRIGAQLDLSFMEACVAMNPA